MGDYLATDMVYFMATDDGMNAVSNMTKILTCGAVDIQAMKEKATAIAAQVKDMKGKVKDAKAIVNGAKNTKAPKTEFGWDSAVKDGKKKVTDAGKGIADAAGSLTDAADMAAKIAKAMENCEPNYYKLGL